MEQQNRRAGANMVDDATNSSTGDTVISVTREAIEKIIEIRDGEPDGADLALMIEITGIQGPQFTYDLAFGPIADAKVDDVVERHGELTVILAGKDVENLRGASLAMSTNPAAPGLAMNNPNSPSPALSIDDVPGDLTGPLTDQVAQVLEQQVNPAIASHGGAARLVSIDETIVYLELMGGCQGCGMASVTLKQGIERILLQAIPEVSEVRDVTDHASGDNPYYASAKK
jgi:Fe/S biogenesis protein NfuA